MDVPSTNNEKYNYYLITYNLCKKNLIKQLHLIKFLQLNQCLKTNQKLFKLLGKLNYCDRVFNNCYEYFESISDSEKWGSSGCKLLNC